MDKPIPRTTRTSDDGIERLPDEGDRVADLDGTTGIVIKRELNLHPVNGEYLWWITYVIRADGQKIER